MTSTTTTVAAPRLSKTAQLAADKLAIRTALTAGDVATVQWLLFSPRTDLEFASRKWLKAKYEYRAFAAAQRQGCRPMSREFALAVASEIADLVAFDLNKPQAAAPVPHADLLRAAMSDDDAHKLVKCSQCREAYEQQELLDGVCGDCIQRAADGSRAVECEDCGKMLGDDETDICHVCRKQQLEQIADML